MIKKVLLFFAIVCMLLSVVSCNINSQETESQEYSETNMQTPEYSETNMQTPEQPEPSRALVSYIEYDVYGNEIIKKTYTYNSNGDIMSELLFVEGEQQEQIEFFYDKNYLLIEKCISTTWDGNTSSNTYKYEYNEGGKVIKEKNINSSGEVIEQIVYEYDDGGRLYCIRDLQKNTIVIYTYWENNSYTMKTEYEIGGVKYFNVFDYQYDELGKLKRETAYKENSSTEISVETIYEYNDSGLLVSSKTYMGGELCDILENEYNDHTLIKKTYSDSFGIYRIVEYSYNKYGELEKETNKLASDVISSYIIYEYKEIK